MCQEVWRDSLVESNMKSVLECIQFCLIKLSDESLSVKDRLFYLDMSCYLREYRAVRQHLIELGKSLPDIEASRLSQSVRVEAVRTGDKGNFSHSDRGG